MIPPEIMLLILFFLFPVMIFAVSVLVTLGCSDEETLRPPIWRLVLGVVAAITIFVTCFLPLFEKFDRELSKKTPGSSIEIIIIKQEIS